MVGLWPEMGSGVMENIVENFGKNNRVIRFLHRASLQSNCQNIHRTARARQARKCAPLFVFSTGPSDKPDCVMRERGIFVDDGKRFQKETEKRT